MNNMRAINKSVSHKIIVSDKKKIARIQRHHQNAQFFVVLAPFITK